MAERQWVIRGFDGLNQIYERKLRLSHLAEGEVGPLLKTLVAKAGLTLDEIVGAYATRRSRMKNDLLRVQRDGPELRFSCGDNPHFSAVVSGGKR
jgi:hypothetical protein